MGITLGTNGYCDVAEVASKNQTTYSTTSKPTQAQVEEFITDRFYEIDAVLDALGYDTPISTTYPKASRILKMVNTFGAAGDAENARHTPGASGSVGKSERGEALLAEFNRLLKMLEKGSLSLIDAPKGDEALQSTAERTIDSSYRENATTGEEEEPAFTHDMDF